MTTALFSKNQGSIIPKDVDGAIVDFQVPDGNTSILKHNLTNYNHEGNKMKDPGDKNTPTLHSNTTVEMGPNY